MKLGTKYLGMSKLFKYPIKSYLKNLSWCEMPWNILQHIGLIHIRGIKTLSPSFYCFCSTLHTSLLTWPFLCRWYSFWKMSFKKSWHIFVCGMMALKFPDTFISVFNKQCLYQLYSEFKMVYFGLSWICVAYYHTI